MELQITGKLIADSGTVQVTDKFKKREFVLELAEEINGNTYTNYAKMQLVQAKCDILDKFNQNDLVVVSFNVKGNRWEKDGKVNYITNLDAWKIENAPQQQATAPQRPGGFGFNQGAPQQAPQQQGGGFAGGYQPQQPAPQQSNGGGFNFGGAGYQQQAPQQPNGGGFYTPNPENLDDLPF